MKTSIFASLLMAGVLVASPTIGVQKTGAPHPVVPRPPETAPERPERRNNDRPKRFHSLNYPNAEIVIKSGSMTNVAHVKSSPPRKSASGATVWGGEVLINGARIVWVCSAGDTSDHYDITVTRGSSTEEGSITFQGNQKSVEIDGVTVAVK